MSDPNGPGAPYELPEGWSWSNMASASSIGSKQVIPRQHPNATYNYVALENIEQGSGRLIDFAPTRGSEIGSNKYTFGPEHVLFGKLRPYLRKVFVPDFEGVSATDLLPIRPHPEMLNREFLARWLLSPLVLEYVVSLQTGVKMPRLRTGDLEEMPVPLPPLPEQQRIVEKIERLLEQSRTAREALDQIPPLLKRFRQAVLAKAFRGELTERDPSDEPAELLLSAPAGKQSPKKRAGRLWGSGVVPGLTSRERTSLPETWVWTKVADLGERPEYTVQVGPMSMRSKDLGVTGVPVLNVGCIQWGYIDERKLDFMPDSLAGAFKRYRVKAGDVMFTRSGTVGRSAVVQPTQEGWLMTFHLLRVRVSPAKCLAEYLQLVFQGALHIHRQTTDASIGTTRAGFNTNLLAMLDVPLAPLGEQRRIVDEVKALFAQADAIEHAVARSLVRAEQVDQAVLVRAFRGGL